LPVYTPVDLSATVIYACAFAAIMDEEPIGKDNDIY